MSLQKIYYRTDGSRVKVEPVLEIERFEEAFTWSYIVYLATPGQEKFEDVTDKHLQEQACATDQEIQ